MSTYAIVRTGGKQYRVERGQSLLVERLPAGDGDSVVLEPLLFVDGSEVVDGEDLGRVSVQARVVAHERGPKLRVVKFKPKRGYKRRTGHRQELTRIEVTTLELSSGRSSQGSGGRSTPRPVAAGQGSASPPGSTGTSGTTTGASGAATGASGAASPASEEAENGA